MDHQHPPDGPSPSLSMLKMFAANLSALCVSIKCNPFALTSHPEYDAVMIGPNNKVKVKDYDEDGHELELFDNDAQIQNGQINITRLNPQAYRLGIITDLENARQLTLSRSTEITNYILNIFRHDNSTTQWMTKDEYIDFLLKLRELLPNMIEIAQQEERMYWYLRLAVEEGSEGGVETIIPKCNLLLQGHKNILEIIPSQHHAAQYANTINFTPPNSEPFPRRLGPPLNSYSFRSTTELEGSDGDLLARSLVFRDNTALQSTDQLNYRAVGARASRLEHTTHHRLDFDPSLIRSSMEAVSNFFIDLNALRLRICEKYKFLAIETKGLQPASAEQEDIELHLPFSRETLPRRPSQGLIHCSKTPVEMIEDIVSMLTSTDGWSDGHERRAGQESLSLPEARVQIDDIGCLLAGDTNIVDWHLPETSQTPLRILVIDLGRRG